VIPAVIVGAALLEIVVWRLAATGRVSVWGPLIAVFALHGALAVLLGEFDGPGERGAALALGLGTGAGLALYAATRAVVSIAVAWPRLRRAVEERYAAARDVPLVAGLVLALGVAVPGEELFWRGLVQDRLVDATSPAVGAILGWLGYVAANVSSASLPIVVGAIVGGAVWAGLAWFTGGVLASLVCHAIWTGLMLAFPPAAGKGMMPA
jgi:membrane protease YdiL (CAAX protease family)